MRILVDMDGVVTNFEKGILDTYRNHHPDKFFIPLDKRSSFFVKEQYPTELQPFIEEIYLSEDFFLNLQPVDGSLEALSEMLSSGFEISICTSPILNNPFCIQEKYDWVSKYLGKCWTEKMIITMDKTIVHGDLLIDDNPKIIGTQIPDWEHIIYSQPYNTHITSKRRLTWQNWKSILNYQ